VLGLKSARIADWVAKTAVFGDAPLQRRCAAPAIEGFLRRKALGRGERQKDISRGKTELPNRACPTTGSDRGSLRDHDLTLIVIPYELALMDGI
jgi:hypothetical protein